MLRDETKPTARPPGRRGWPLLGDLAAFSRDSTGFLLRLACEHGDVAHFRLGRQDAYQLSHPDFIRDVLVTHSKKFSKTRGLDRAKSLLGNGLLTSDGELHRRQRRILQPAFSRQRVAAHGPIMTRHASRTCDNWEDGAQFDMFDEMIRLTLSIVGETLFGVDIESSTSEIGDAMATGWEYFNRSMLPLPALVDRLPRFTANRFERARSYLDDLVFGIIAERRASDGSGEDLLSILLRAQDEEDGTGMSDQQARDEIMTMFLAGHESTATVLTWLWFVLSRNPEVERQFHAEIDRVLQGRVPTVEDLPRLEYTRMILNESMRIFPPVWTLTRRALEDYEVGGFTLPAGSVVGVSQYVTHRDPRYFPDPDRFDPLRWTQDEVGKRPKYSYFPFGGGPRLCIGEAFGTMEALLLIATLGQHWRARVPDDFEPRFDPLITLRPKHGVPVRMERRSSPHAALGEVLETQIS